MGFRAPVLSTFFLASALWAQTGTGGGGKGGTNSNLNGFTCTANPTVAPTLRAEGLTEQTGDIVISCTGGTPTASGKDIPQLNFQLTLNTGFTSRLIGTGGIPTTDATLLIGDPGSASNSKTPQLLCITPRIGCTGVGPVQYGTNVPNLYLGSLRNSTTVTFEGIPIDPPGTAGITRQFRFTNIRANVNQAWINEVSYNPSLTQAPITASVSISDCYSGSPISLIGSPFTLGNGQPSFGFGVTATTLTQVRNATPTAIGGGLPVFSVFYTELFPHTFRSRNAAANLTNPTGIGLQNIPGQNYFSESGFVPWTPSTLSLQPSLTLSYLNSLPVLPGLADTGTIHITTLELPPTAGFKIQVPSQVPLTLQSNGAVMGTVFISPLGGTVVGNNIQFTPAAGGSLSIYSEVEATTSSTSAGLNSYSIPFTVLGPSSVIPTHIQGAGQYATLIFPQNIFTPTSPNYAGYPIWSTIDNGISSPPGNPYQHVASIVDAFQDLPTVNFFGTPDPLFWEAPGGVIAPRIYNVGVVSPLQTPMNLTLTKDPTATWLNAQLNTSKTPATIFLSVNQVMTPSNNSTTLLLTSPQESGATFSLPIKYNVSLEPWITRYGFGHSASYVPQVAAPGMPFLMAGASFGPSTLAGFTLGTDGKVSTTVGNTQVLFDGLPAPLIYSVNLSGTGYVAGMVPFEVAGKSQTNVQVVYNNVKSPPVSIFVTDAVPGLLTADTSGGGLGAIRNANQSVNSDKNKAAQGEVVSAYGGGGGQTNPVGRTGGVTGVGATVGAFNLPVTVWLDGAEVTDVPYSGPAPDLIEGYFQVNFRIPMTARRGNLPLQIQFGDKLTQPGVTVAVK